MKNNDLFLHYAPETKKVIAEFVAGRIGGSEFREILKHIRRELNQAQRSTITSYSNSPEDRRENHTAYYEKYIGEHHQDALFVNLVDHIHSETNFYCADEKARSELNSSKTEGIRYLSTDEMRGLVREIYEKSVSDGIWQGADVS